MNTDTTNGLIDAAAAVRVANERLAEAVVDARLQGLSWAQIAAPLGITRQAAQQRFGD